jgi:FKBP-type peptidyl-prolyl cis-trans isomerase FkpA
LAGRRFANDAPKRNVASGHLFLAKTSRNLQRVIRRFAPHSAEQAKFCKTCCSYPEKDSEKAVLLAISRKAFYSVGMMRIAFFVAALLPFAVGLAGAEGKVDTRETHSTPDARNVPETDLSYAFGLALGYDLKDSGLTIDYARFAEGFKAAMEEQGAEITLDEAMEVIRTAFIEMQEAKAAEALAQSEEFLRQNAERDGVQVTESGLQYEALFQGDGEKPSADDIVRVHYEGSLIDGKVFDSSREKDEPVDFPLNAVIPGWEEGIQLMNVGSRYKLYVPPELGYGEWGAGDFVPPHAVLIFDIELLDVIHSDADNAEAADTEADSAEAAGKTADTEADSAEAAEETADTEADNAEAAVETADTETDNAGAAEETADTEADSAEAAEETADGGE